MTPLSRVVMLGGLLLAGWGAFPVGSRGQPPADPSAPPGKGAGARKDTAAAEALPAEQAAFFEKNIRPVLVKECYSCHSKTAEKLRGGLLLDSREGLSKGGKSGGERPQPPSE